jgi:hypothetical protein
VYPNHTIEYLYKIPQIAAELEIGDDQVKSSMVSGRYSTAISPRYSIPTLISTGLRNGSRN